MESRTGRVARQLTQWVGGTIMVLMLAFVLIDLSLQMHYIHKYQDTIATQGAEGLRLLLSGRTLRDDNDAMSRIFDGVAYLEGRRAGAIVFDPEGQIMYDTPLARSRERGETKSLFVEAASDEPVTFRRTIAGVPICAAAVRFQSKDDPPEEGVAVYLVNTAEYRQSALFLWGWRSLIILVIVIGVMLAVRIPVKKFVLDPMDGLFVGAYAASKDDYRELPPCPVDNEFRDLYDMFNRLMSHLSDTRIFEASLMEEEAGAPGEDSDDRPESR
jgi:hypothetical protein